MSKSFIYVSIICALLATPAFAADTPAPKDEKKGNNITIQMDPKVAEKNKAYDEAVKKLTPEQKEILSKFEKASIGASDLELKGLEKAMQVKFCEGKEGTAIAKDKPKYHAELGVYMNQRQALARAARRKLDATWRAEATFIDAALFDAHLHFLYSLMMGMAVPTMKINLENHGYDKTDCAAVATELDEAFAQTSKQAATAAGPGAGDIDQIKAAAEAGKPEAQVALGMMHMVGKGVAKDTAKGMELLTRAAEGGDPYGQFMLGLAYSTDMLGTEPDKEKAKLWLGKSAAQGYKKAEMALASLDKMPPPVSKEETLKKAEAGDPAAQYTVGSGYLQGFGKYEQKPEEGIRWLLLSAGQGYPLAMSDLAVHFMSNGRTAEGLNWMTKAAKAGVVNSQVALGQYYSGKDKEQALFWLKKAAEQGEPRAIKMLKQLEAAPTP